MTSCRVCDTPISDEDEVKQANLTVSIHCPRCGKFVLTRTLYEDLPSLLTPHQRTVLSHRLRLQQSKGEPSVVYNKELSAWRLDEPLPSPAEQVSNLILWIGAHQRSPAEVAEISEPAISALIGAAMTPTSPTCGLDWLLMQSELKPFIEMGPTATSDLAFSLTMAGWERYEAIKRAQVESHRVLMAMKFDNAELNRVVDDYFKPAVARAGFELWLLTDAQPAGLIDDQLRVALRTSRFLIADVTHGSHGAYWEAGFAEGLGRPVIYTCRKNEWDERKSHFDTNHLVTIVWDPEKLDDAARSLTATIRATLPGEAKMQD